METLYKILDLLKYSPTQPLIFTSGLFLFAFLFFCVVYYMLRNRVNTRILFVTAFSLYFYYKTSGLYFLLLVGVAFSDYNIGWMIHRGKSLLARRWFLALSVCINVGLLSYFKYTNFLLDIFTPIIDHPFRIENLFLPIGISFFTFQSMSYVIDIYRRRIEPLHKYSDYLFYVSFFPQLVAGPIVRARDFIPQIHRNPLVVTREQFGEGVFLIMCGLFKKAVISDYISMNFVDRVFADPLLYSGFENLMGVYGYALQIYCDFSGYSDIAIGIALLLGFRFNANFDSPYKSATITEFWRRWHISLSSWLKDYLYISLGGNRKGKTRTYINLLITMLLGGLWHGAAMRFVLWGLWHGASLGVHKAVMDRFSSFKAQGQDMTPLRRVIGIIITFNIVCLGWIFFRAESMQIGWQVLAQIFTNFSPAIALDFIVGYKWVVMLMVLGYLLHFAPYKLELKTKTLFERMPLPAHAACIALVIWIIMQTQSSQIQPFIYFQF